MWDRGSSGSTYRDIGGWWVWGWRLPRCNSTSTLGAVAVASRYPALEVTLSPGSIMTRRNWMG